MQDETTSTESPRDVIGYCFLEKRECLGLMDLNLAARVG